MLSYHSIWLSVYKWKPVDSYFWPLGSIIVRIKMLILITVMSWSHVTSHVMDLTRSGQFQIITDPVPRGWLSHQSPDYLIFRINLPTFGSTFWINLLNQPTQSAFSLNRRRHWLVVRYFLQTYVHRIVLLPTEVRMIQVVDLLADHPLVEA